MEYSTLCSVFTAKYIKRSWQQALATWVYPTNMPLMIRYWRLTYDKFRAAMDTAPAAPWSFLPPEHAAPV